MKTKDIIVGLVMLLGATMTQAQTTPQITPQIIIGGNVYGGGNKGDLAGSTHVTINDGVLLGDEDFNGSLPGAVSEAGVKFTQEEIDAAQEGDPAYGKTTDDWKVEPSTYTEKSAAVYNAKLYLARGGNVYGGARLAKVGGTSNVTINGGYVLNVYGGNDISGAVTGGTNVNIFSTICGDVYGGGNGSYIYWDQPYNEAVITHITSALSSAHYTEAHIDYVADLQKDTHYEVPTGRNSLDALNAMRPSAPSTKILLQGTADKQVFVNGGVYCGGNSATLSTATGAGSPTAELMLGKYVAARNIFMGCNGANLVADATLTYLDDPDVSTINTKSATNLETPANMEKYMSAVAMGIESKLTFTDDYKTALTNNVLETAHIGNFFCGGNVGSMTKDGVHEFHFAKAVYIHEKLVGGCNTAKVPAFSGRNAEYLGGVLGTKGTAEGTEDTKVWLKLSGTYLEPRRLTFDVDALTLNYEWYMSDGDGDPETDDGSLKWANVYGGCFSSGKINGGVKIDIDKPTVNYSTIFKTKAAENSGVDRYDQAQDVFCKTLSVFGGGYGTEATIEGNTTINVSGDGVVFQVFGGGEKGPVNGNTTINLKGGSVNEIYGGGFAGDVLGHTTVNLDGGWFFDTFGGACNADVRDYTEVFIGKNGSPEGYNVYGGNDFGGKVGLSSATGYTPKTHEGYTYNTTTHIATEAPIESDTYVEYYHGKVDSIAGGNYGNYDYEIKYARIAQELIDMGEKDPDFSYAKPNINKSFLNICTPDLHNTDAVKYFLGGSEGASGEATNDNMQHATYVLVNAPGLEMKSTNVYGAGAHAGLCSGSSGGSTEVYLLKGTVHNVFGGSLNEGGTEQAHVIVPVGSEIHVNAIFGGSDGELTEEYEERMLPQQTGETDEEYNERVYWVNMIPCDTKNAIVDYHSSKSTVEEAIYGGNNFQRRTVFSTININVPVQNKAGELIDVFGAGLGENSWACCTKVNLNYGARVANVYGGGSNGRVFESLSEWERLMVTYRKNPDRYNNGPAPANYFTDIPLIHQWLDDPSQGAKFTDPAYYTHEDANGVDHYLDNMPHVEWQAGSPNIPVNNIRFEEYCQNVLGMTVEKATTARTKYNNKWDWNPDDHNTNVFINEGAVVEGNAFAGGKGSNASVSGRTCLTLNGGEVKGNIYGGGEEGFVADRYLLGMDKVNVTINGGTWENSDGGAPLSHIEDEAINDTIASTRVYINGGKVHYVYGGGLAGHIGCRVLNWDDRTLQSYDPTVSYGLVMAPTFVVVGKRNKADATFYDGKPTITRSVFGGGERGRVAGTANLTINNGYIGYRYENGQFVENAVGEDGAILNENGNAFGAGYGEGALVYHTNVRMYGGVIRNSLYGGGEIAAVGDGSTEEVEGSSLRSLKEILCPGSTHVEMYNGHVQRDVFGGGRGYSYDRTGNEITGSELYTDGYVFGHTIAHVHGGEVGTEDGVAQGYGNVFGGGNIGYVYSGFGKADRTKDTGAPGHYYYYSDQETKVCKTGYDSFDGSRYEEDDVISTWAWSLLPGSEQGKWETRAANLLTEDCAVVVSPYAQVKTKWKDFTNPLNTDDDPDNDVWTNLPLDEVAVTIDDNGYKPYDYVPIGDLNTLKAKDDISTVTATAPKRADYASDEAYNQAYATFVQNNRNDFLASDRAKWLKLDDTGIIIHNAVFGGGNVSIGSDKIFANATTIYGNVTATVNDVFSRDLISIGFEHVGGLYGGGNLSLTNGYREVHIENYGTDYYSLESEVSLDDYRTKLSDREKAYFRLRYKAKTDISAYTDETAGVTFPSIPKDKQIWEDEYKDLPAAQQNTPGTEDKWAIDGVCNLHAGRLLNTIQRADLVGMYGSRLVLQGAQDRVTDVVDYTRYTINRVGELSLMKEKAPYAPSDDSKAHGNYFGIYSVVNRLGNLTSDVLFEDSRPADEIKTGEPTTYYDYKYENRTKRKRNHGTCHNKVALASGVYLELTTEHSTKDVKDYGYITGIIELDLINAKADAVGGGYVYAKNEHRIRAYYPKRQNVTLSSYNSGLRTYKRYIYDPTDPDVSTLTAAEKVDCSEPADWGTFLEIETSGNFIHDANKKIIIDDCYPNNAEYHPSDDNYSPAHYWYVKGQIYVYDQVISAYTGTATAYLKEVKIPLTITAGSHGKLQLINVQPNLYAYKGSSGSVIGESGQPVNNGAQTYYLNDVIDYWTYSQLSDTEKGYFVQETLRAVKPFKTSEDGEVRTDTIKTAADYLTFKNSLPSKTIDDVSVKALYSVEEGKWVPADEIFHSSNKMGHNTGYVLAFKMDTPSDWNNWYIPKTGSDTDISTTAWNNLTDVQKATYMAGPTFSPLSSTAFGQRDYARGELIPKEIYDNYPYKNAASVPGDQATVTICYAAKEPITYSGGTINTGAPISQTRYNELLTNYPDELKATDFEQALLCTETIQLSEDQYLFNGEVVSTDQMNAMKGIFITTYKDKQLEQYMLDNHLDQTNATAIENAKTATGYEDGALATEAGTEANKIFADNLTLAYICEVAGLYGGQAYDADQNYNPVASWCALDATDREYFTFNEDAFDLIRYDNYNSTAYDKYGKDDTTYPYFPTKMSKYGSPYDDAKPVEYTATYTGTSTTLSQEITKIRYSYDSGVVLPVGTSLKGYYTRSGDTYTACNVEATADGTTTYYKSVGSTETDNTLNNGDVLERGEYEEKIVNEQYHFAPITVNKSSTAQNYYIVTSPFIKGDVPYIAGQTISAATYVSLGATERAKVQTVSINYNHYKGSASPEPEYVILFYNTENFVRKGATDVKKVEIATGVVDDTNPYSTGETVPQGTFLTQAEYSKLTNDQKNFLIKGQEPTETSTLYVSRESEIEDLGKERIYTVIYQYTYNESDDADNVELANELHIINIHVQFESGVPTIGELLPPATVLPGSTVGLKQPSVTKGAYEILGGGWEIFNDYDDALSHYNGDDFYNNSTPVYWYQNHWEENANHHGCWVAYYAMTRAGKTYSKPVPLSVANYHDIADIMADKENHLFVDHTGVQRESKVYINDYTTDDPATSKNGLDLLKDLYDLSLVTEGSTDYTIDGDKKITAATGDDANSNLVDHILLDSHVRAGENLEIIVRTDIDHTGSEWTSLGSSSATCFSGNVHGDGHTISGLDHSLFNWLCGNVYNLGVTGSFTGAGIAENGDGYVENCWVKTSAPNTSDNPSEVLQTGEGHYAVFGNPSRTSGGLVQVVNCYYPESNAYTVPSSDTHGKAIKMTDAEFYNGTVAYDLNGFYLKERYDRNRGSATAIGDTYVMDRYRDGDFIYANHIIPTKDDVRKQLDGSYLPLWPDDYLFFGQLLTYGYNDERPHEPLPTVIYKVEKDDGILAPYMYLPETDRANRIYRAPAYYRSKVMGVFHYNPFCNLAGHSADGTKEAYPDMTATDFSGYNDVFKATDGTPNAYQTGFVKSAPYDAGRGLEIYGAFYPPLLDDGGLIGIRNRDLTHNLLQYAPYVKLDPDTDLPDETNSPAVVKTHDVVINTTTDPVFSDYYQKDDADPNEVYKTVAAVNSGSVRAHSVERTSDTSTDYIAHRDHLLVDFHDFNCPIEYKFDGDHRMWHQRAPGNYVGHLKDAFGNDYLNGTGWEGISIPFKAELVTTDQKGEITHFYSGSEESTNGTHTKIGHEYWLREFTAGGKTVEGNSVYEANMTYPDAVTGSKTVTNTFLWDYYYNENTTPYHHEDTNNDEYQTYYSSSRTYDDYPRLANATPYIIGFPGERYYEFDLSGVFEAETTADPDPEKLGKQTITFVSNTGITIGVSDDELLNASVTKDGYTFKPSYLYETLESVTENQVSTAAKSYALNDAGSAYVAVTRADDAAAGVGDVIVPPFRPYFTSPAGTNPARPVARSIIFSNEKSEPKGVEEHDDPREEKVYGTLKIYPGHKKIVVESSLSYTANVRILNPAGVTVKSFSIEPGETIETLIINSGVYIVTTDDRYYIKKLSVR